MLFSGVDFLFWFLPIFMIIYLIAPARFRNIVLLIGSLFFYGVGEPFYVLLLVFSILLNYFFAAYGSWEPSRPMKDRKKSAARRRKMACSVAIVLDLSILFLFKYWDFAAENINKIAGNEAIPILSLALPLGVSFYVFQMISFQVDYYRGVFTTKPTLIEFGAYVSMFPQLIAGPIVKYTEVAERMKDRKIRAATLESGIRTFILGLGAKVLLANMIGTLWNGIMTAGAGNLSASVAWLGAFAYSFQIYFDFWGYSLMAIGLGKMLGFKLPKNFKQPYAAKSISEFWRRWHVTLGRWFREYLYIPLGGNRKGMLCTLRNLLLVWAFTGLWHGANWNFVIWGFNFFVILAIEKCGIAKKLEKTKVLGHIYVIILIPVTWVVFAITDLNMLLSYLQNMIGIHASEILVGASQFQRYLAEYWWLLILCIVFATPIPAKFYQARKKKWYMILFLFVVFWASVYEIIQGNNNPFLYFRF